MERGAGPAASSTDRLPLPPGTKILEVKEWFQNREDMLELRHVNKITGLIIDSFKPGHSQALRGTWTPLPGQLGSRGGASHAP